MRLRDSHGDFRLAEIISAIQRVDPTRDRSSIQPVVQGMTANAGKGPTSPCGKPLRRVSRGLYRLSDSLPAAELRQSLQTPRDRAASSAPWSRRHARDEQVARRIAVLTTTFRDCLDTYDAHPPFRKAGQYESHRRTIERRRAWPTVGQAISDDLFVTDLYHVLKAWGIGQRGSHLVPLSTFREQLRVHSPDLAELETLRLDDEAMNAEEVALALWCVIGTLGVVTNQSLIVSGTKTLHHLLPDLVPPMDREYTGTFFLWKGSDTKSAQQRTFSRTFASYAQLALATHPAQYVGTHWRTSVSKVLDNAVVGYCKTH